MNNNINNTVMIKMMGKECMISRIMEIKKQRKMKIIIMKGNYAMKILSTKEMEVIKIVEIIQKIMEIIKK